LDALDEFPVLATFVERGLISEVLHPVKSGKEATVFCCRGTPSSGAAHFAAKVYRARERRGFKNDAIYREGRFIPGARARRAVAAKTAFGREVEFAFWIGHEWATLRALHSAGADVPRPVAFAEGAILLEFLGEDGVAAPPLALAPLGAAEAGEAIDRLLANVELMLARNVVHGDLSPWNVLWAGGAPRVIDFPQAVDPRTNPSAFALLAHDVEALCRWAARLGAQRDAAGFAIDLWRRFTMGAL
jgi:RIO kinase 1